jgi:hypothetical protein
MNAKFEKWWADQLALNGGIYIGADYNHWAGKGWQAAIQSLEVAPELEDVFKDAFDDIYDGDNMRLANSCALQRFLSALKEQAK